RQAAPDPGRRAHRQPRHRQRRRGALAAHRGRGPRRDRGDGHPQPDPRRRGATHHPPAGRAGGLRNPAGRLRGTPMFRNYLAAALRNLARNKLYAGVTILGLAVGFAAALLIGLYVRDELTFDRFIPRNGQVYLVTETLAFSGSKPIETH